MTKCPKCGTRLAAKKTVCKYCRAEFFGLRDAVYCSKACKQKAYRRNKSSNQPKEKYDA